MGKKKPGLRLSNWKHEIDTGDIPSGASFLITEEDTTGTIHDRMKDIGAALLVKTVTGLAAGTLTESPQDGNPDTLKHAPKIHTDTCRINFSQTVDEVYNLIADRPLSGCLDHPQ